MEGDLAQDALEVVRDAHVPEVLVDDPDLLRRLVDQELEQTRSDALRAQLLVEKAEVLDTQLDDAEGALDALETALEADPNSIQALWRLENHHRSRRNVPALARTLDRIVACAQTFGFIAPDSSCTPLPFDDYHDAIYVYSDLRYHELDPTLASLVEELDEDASSYRSTHVWFPMQFSHVEVYSIDGVPQVYEIAFRQWLDPECGVLLWVVYTVDSCFNVVSVTDYV